MKIAVLFAIFSLASADLVKDANDLLAEIKNAPETALNAAQEIKLKSLVLQSIVSLQGKDNNCALVSKQISIKLDDVFNSIGNLSEIVSAVKATVDTVLVPAAEVKKIGRPQVPCGNVFEFPVPSIVYPQVPSQPRPEQNAYRSFVVAEDKVNPTTPRNTEDVYYYPYGYAVGGK